MGSKKSEMNEIDSNVEFELEEDQVAHGDQTDFDQADLDQTADPVDELAGFQAAEVEDIDQLSEDQISSIVESLLFSSEKPITTLGIKSAFAGTDVKAADIRAALERLRIDYDNSNRGVQIEEVAGGYQLRTKSINRTFLARTVKARPFRLSGPALEVLSIVAYKQPCTKAAVDDVRGVESGHLMRGLMDRGLMRFAGKSELPGRPMLYETTKKFLETFGLRNIQELPTLNEIDQLIPEGIGEEEKQKPKLGDVTDELSTEIGTSSYSQNEEELLDIASELKAIDTTTAFFEEEKRRERDRRDRERAEDIRERLTVGEVVDDRDRRWLDRYEQPKEQMNGEPEPTAP